MPTVLKKKNKVKKNIVDKTESYANSLDLMSMWEDYAHSFNENGTQKYKTVWSFVCKQTKNSKERDILYWMLGPKVTLEKGQIPKYKLDQYDWEEKRQKGFWFSSENIEKLSADVKHKASAYEAVKEAGQVNVNTISVLNKLLETVLSEFGGQLFLPNLNMKENAYRTQLLLQLIEKITTISNSAQLMYARTQGLDLERLDEFFKLFGNQIGQTGALLLGNTLQGQVDTKENKLNTQFAKVVKMVTAKATEYDLPIPADISAAIQEVEEQDSKPTKKSKVN